MPIAKEIYLCPQCLDWFESENDALECCLSGEDEKVEETTVYFCEGCGESFGNLQLAIAHELICPKCPESCQNCNNYENGHRHFPCLRFTLDRDFTPCEQYARAKVVG